MKKIVDIIKGLFDMQEPLKDPNRSINYYRPDWIEPEEEADDYKKWRKYIDGLYAFDALKDFPAEFEFSNMTDPYLVKKQGKRAHAATRTLFNIGEESPRVEWNTDFPPKPEFVEHEKFHAKRAEPNYFSDWNPATARHFETASDWLGGLLRRAQLPASIGGSKDSSLARSFVEAAAPNNQNRLNAAEELGAYMYEEGWNKKQKPYWMSDRDYQIFLNMISHRMGW